MARYKEKLRRKRYTYKLEEIIIPKFDTVFCNPTKFMIIFDSGWASKIERARKVVLLLFLWGNWNCDRTCNPFPWSLTQRSKGRTWWSSMAFKGLSLRRLRVSMDHPTICQVLYKHDFILSTLWDDEDSSCCTDEDSEAGHESTSFGNTWLLESVSPAPDSCSSQWATWPSLIGGWRPIATSHWMTHFQPKWWDKFYLCNMSYSCMEGMSWGKQRVHRRIQAQAGKH